MVVRTEVSYMLVAFFQLSTNVLLGFVGCFAGSVGYDKGNSGVDEEALTRMSDEIKASSEK